MSLVKPYVKHVRVPKDSTYWFPTVPDQVEHVTSRESSDERACERTSVTVAQRSADRALGTVAGEAGGAVASGAVAGGAGKRSEVPR